MPDVFRTEPLPAAHPFWQHLKMTVTPPTSARTLREKSMGQTTGKMAALQGRASHFQPSRCG
jgi:glyoxylate/hydroxypyruvate reductase A